MTPEPELTDPLAPAVVAMLGICDPKAEMEPPLVSERRVLHHGRVYLLEFRVRRVGDEAVNAEREPAK